MARRCVLRLLLDELLLIVNLLRVDVLLLCINLPPVSKKLTLIDALLRCTNLLQLDELLELSLTGRCVVFAIWLIVRDRDDDALVVCLVEEGSQRLNLCTRCLLA